MTINCDGRVTHRVCVFAVLIQLHICPYAIFQDLALIVLAAHEESGSATPALARAVGLWHHSPPRQPSASRRAIVHQHAAGARPGERDGTSLPGRRSRDGGRRRARLSGKARLNKGHSSIKGSVGNYGPGRSSVVTTSLEHFILHSANSRVKQLARISQESPATSYGSTCVMRSRCPFVRRLDSPATNESTTWKLHLWDCASQCRPMLICTACSLFVTRVQILAVINVTLCLAHDFISLSWWSACPGSVVLISQFAECAKTHRNSLFFFF